LLAFASLQKQMVNTVLMFIQHNQICK